MLPSPAIRGGVRSATVLYVDVTNNAEHAAGLLYSAGASWFMDAFGLNVGFTRVLRCRSASACFCSRSDNRTSRFVRYRSAADMYRLRCRHGGVPAADISAAVRMVIPLC
jgi:hypothetical protein